MRRRGLARLGSVVAHAAPAGGFGNLSFAQKTTKAAQRSARTRQNKAHDALVKRIESSPGPGFGQPAALQPPPSAWQANGARLRQDVAQPSFAAQAAPASQASGGSVGGVGSIVGASASSSSSSSSSSSGGDGYVTQAGHATQQQAARQESRSSNGAHAHAAEPHTPSPAERAGLGPLPAGASGDEPEEVGEQAIAAAFRDEPPADVHVVNTAAAARAAAARLLALPDAVFACDTEVMDIDVSSHSPCCHGKVICFSVYAGPDVHWGEQPPAEGAPRAAMLWVDVWLGGDEARAGEAREIVEAFRPFWESARHKKVWHNYSFDRHVMEQLGLGMAGFGGDTMHMARLWDSSRQGRGGYSLQALTSAAELMGDGSGADVRGKVSMKELFGRRNIKKDGTEGKLVVLPAVEELQRGADTRWRWVNYSAFDAKATWDLHAALASKLQAMPAVLDPAVAADYAQAGVHLRSMWDVYRHSWLPFGALLTDMEAVGMAVDRPHLAAAQQRAEAEQAQAQERFRRWASRRVADAQYMNVGSCAQVQQLLFAGADNRDKDKGKDPLPRARVFKVPNTMGLLGEKDKKAKKNWDITLHSVWGPDADSPLAPEVFTPAGVPACSTPVLKALAGKPGRARRKLAELGLEEEAQDLSMVRGVGEDGSSEDEGAPPPGEGDEEEEGAAWPVDDAEIQGGLHREKQEAVAHKSREELAGIAAREGYGPLFSQFGSVAEGLRACDAVDSLVDASAIDTLLSNFIVPLQSDAISKPDARGVYRVHCSLNINTETGRLSARRPNLQNQPALEKDRYRVRKAFTADVAAGRTLVVADYGQLELRILAHLARCASMIAAFEAGGDFHSRTALGMYDHIQEAVAKERCLLEWEGEGPPPLPLLKDAFAAERRKAKVLNFSIAYGKTAHGLSKDWRVGLEEAKDTVERWYADRPEVRDWQEEQREDARSKGYVTTLLGRRRRLPDAANSRNRAAQSHALRAAINTPVQGSAADIATAAMLRINADQQLRDMGWRLLLQVHDEVILEGPRETADEARARVVACMRSPFSGLTERPLLVDLVVDAKHADTWYEAK